MKLKNKLVTILTAASLSLFAAPTFFSLAKESTVKGFAEGTVGAQTLTGTVNAADIESGTTENPKTYLVQGNVLINGTVNVNGHVVFVGDAADGADEIKSQSHDGPFFSVPNGSSLTMKNLTVDGGAVWSGEENDVLSRGLNNVGIKRETQTGVGEEAKTTQYNLFAYEGKLVLTDCTVQNHDGGQLFFSNATGGTRELIVTDCKINDNNGGILWTRNTATFTDVEMAYNYGQPSVFRLCTNARATLSNCDVHHNYSVGSGTLYGYSSTMTLQENTKVRNNFTEGDGGAINCSNGTVNVTDAFITDNVAQGNGGGIYRNGTSLVNITNVEIRGNRATNGGGIYSGSSRGFYLNSGLITENRAEKGSAVYATESVYTFLPGGEITGNYGDTAVYIQNGFVGLSGVTIYGNENKNLYIENHNGVSINENTGDISLSWAENVTVTLSKSDDSDLTNVLNKIRYEDVEEGKACVPFVKEDGSKIEFVTLVLNGGTISSSDNGGAPLPSLQKTNYDFMGWYEDEERNVPLEEITGNATYYAAWGATVRFDAGKKANNPQNVLLQAGKPYGELPTVTANGYAFLGWYTQPHGGVKKTATDIFNGKETLYAQWKVSEYTLILAPNGGTGTPVEIQMEYGESKELPSIETLGFAYEGRNFMGWAFDSEVIDNTEKIVEYLDAPTVKNLTGEANGEVTLYAIWTEKLVPQISVDLTPQTYNYDGRTKWSFLLNGEPFAEGYNVSYYQNGQPILTTGAINLGVYDIKIELGGSSYDDDEYELYSVFIEGGLIVDGRILTENDFVFDEEASYVYTGEEIKDVLLVNWNGDFRLQDMVEGTDYTVTYANNVNAGKANVTVVGKGKYQGTLTYQFDILKADPVVEWTEAFTGEAGQPLSTISLPAGYAWENPAEIIQCSERHYALTFTPTDENNYNIVTHTVKVSNSAVHAYTNDCDEECGVCGATRTIVHVPNEDDGDCTTAITCSVCQEITTAAKEHVFDNACDEECNLCATTREVGGHVYGSDNVCDDCGHETTPVAPDSSEEDVSASTSDTSEKEETSSSPKDDKVVVNLISCSSQIGSSIFVALALAAIAVTLKRKGVFNKNQK